MKRFIRVLALVCMMSVVFSMVGSAFAESKSYKGVGTVTYTVNTGKKDATLKISVAKGKIQAYTGIMGRRVKKNCGASYTVTVSDFGSRDVSTDWGGSAAFKLKKNRTYYITIEYKTWLPGNSWDMTLNNAEWIKNPTVKLSVNHSAKIR